MAADAVHRVRKPKTQRGKRFLEHRAAKLIENTKTSLVVRGGNTSEIVSQCLKDLNQLKLPNSVMLKWRNPFNLFDNDTDIEKFALKYDASLFAFGSHSKKRPNNLIIGRMYDFHVLDMMEFGLSDFKPISSFKVPKCTAGIKPCLIFSGEAFQQNASFVRAKNLLIDYFRGEEVENLRLQGLELAICFTVVNGRVHMRTYRIMLKKSGTKTPRVEIEEMGPSMNLTLRRSRLASDDLLKTAMKQPKQLQKKSVKNVSHDVFGTKLARVHVGKQNMNQLQTRKLKGLRKTDSRKRTKTDRISENAPQEKLQRL